MSKIKISELTLEKLQNITEKVLKIQVKPGSKKEDVFFDEEKKIFIFRVKAPAEDGKANDAVLKLLKKKTGLSGKIISGATSKKKLIKLE
ncbi:MAG: DUF167 domain-containing protein [Candidatus Woesearchaeota archaeon]|jgi:uncharacterized protein (TIGR00251 family)